MNRAVSVAIEDLVRLKAEARGFSFLPRQPVASLLSGRHQSRLRGRGLAFEEMRRYHPGDDIRTIDWRATARLRSAHVRVYSEERERPVLLVVDQRTPMYFGSRRVMKSVAAAEFAALAAWRALDGGDRVGGLVFNEEKITTVKPNRGPTQALRLFHEISIANQRLTEGPVEGSVGLNDALETAQRNAKHDHLVILLSDLDGADERTGELATRLAAHNDVLVVAVYDPLGAGLAGSPGMHASDRGQSWEIPPGRAFKEAFKGEFEKMVTHWRDVFRGIRIPLFPLSTASPVASQVRELMGEQAHG